MLLTISVTVIAACFLIILSFLAPLLLKFYQISSDLKKLIETLNVQIVPLSCDLKDITRQTKDIMVSISRKVDQLEEGISAVSDMAVRMQEFQKQIQQRVGPPLIELATLLGMVIRGLQSIIKIFRP